MSDAVFLSSQNLRSRAQLNQFLLLSASLLFFSCAGYLPLGAVYASNVRETSEDITEEEGGKFGFGLLAELELGVSLRDIYVPLDLTAYLGYKSSVFSGATIGMRLHLDLYFVSPFVGVEVPNTDMDDGSLNVYTAGIDIPFLREAWIKNESSGGLRAVFNYYDYKTSAISNDWDLGIAIVGIGWTTLFKRDTPKVETPQPPVQQQPAPKRQTPSAHPTITQEELNRIELAYAETVDLIRARGKHLYVGRLGMPRQQFIQRYQGSPNKQAVANAREIKLEWFDIRTTSQEDIVAQAKREANDFLKVRMIHDWVADIFAYDYDYLWRMENLGTGNAKYTLGELVRLQRGVCFEYAILFWFLLDNAGLDVYLISDHSQPGIGHAYNMVVIDGTGYIIDTTWDSGNVYENGRIKEFKRMKSKDYFMPSVSQSYKQRGW